MTDTPPTDGTEATLPPALDPTQTPIYQMSFAQLVAAQLSLLTATEAATAELTALQVGLFTNLASLSIPVGTDIVQTSGYRVAGRGGAKYVATTATGLTANACTVQTTNGRWFTLAPDEIKTPLKLGAAASGSSNPASGVFTSLAALQAAYPFATSLYQELDYLAIQFGLNLGGQLDSDQLAYVLCNSNAASQTPLAVVSGESWGNFHGSTLNFGTMAAQTASVHEISNYNFATSSGWSNATIYAPSAITNFSFGGGAATYTDPSTYPGTTSSGGHFGQFGHQVTLAPGKYRAICTVTTSLGASYASGNPNPPFGAIQFFASGPGNGANFTGQSKALAGIGSALASPVTQTIEMDFIVTTTTTAWLTFSGGGYANFSISYFDIVPWIGNCAVLATRDGASEHYPISQPLEGMELIGPGSTVGVTGVLFKSFSNQDGVISKLDNCSIHGWGKGVDFQDGAYLFEGIGNEVYGNGIGYKFTGGANSGENMRLVNGGIFNNTAGIDNTGGAEWTLFGTSLDYNLQAIVNNYGGRIELHGVHAEMEVPVTAGLPLFQCFAGGQIQMHGGMFLGAGGIGTAPEPPIQLTTALCRFRLYGTQVYNLTSASGVACSGAGVLDAPGGWMNAGNPNVGPLLSNAVQMDVLAGAGTFEAVTSPFSLGDAEGINIAGGILSQSGATITDRWTSQDLSASISSAYAHSGSKSLSITKSGEGNGSPDNQVLFLFPVRQGQDVWTSFWWLAPANVGTGSATLYARLFWVKRLGSDAYGRPILSGVAGFRGESDITVPLAGSPTWSQWAHSTAYTPDGTSATTVLGAAGAPAWATDLCIVLDTESLPAMTIYIDDLIANVL